jgi:hypothetical protein
MTTCAIALLAGALAFAQAELPKEVLDLARIKAKVHENLSRLPRYTCLESVERANRPPGKPDFHVVDTLHLEVTRIGEDEFYSWPGGRQFEGSALALVGSGTISTGEFFGHAANVFDNPATQIHFAGKERYRDRAALRYDYMTASFASGWTLNFAGHKGVASSYGSFWADADSLELLRLDSFAGDIPAGLPFLAVTSRIDYTRVQIGDARVILPQSAEMSVTRPDGEDRNRLAFGHWRPYVTESTLVVDERAPAAEAVKASVQEFTLPANLAIALRLEQPIDSSSAGEGDPITARLAADLKVKSAVVVPKGALVRGRIRRLERYSEPVPHFIVGLEFAEIEFDGKRWLFQARLEQVDPIPGLSWVLSNKHAESFGGKPGEATMQIFKGETLATADVPGVGTFFMQGTRFRLPGGFHMLWRTTGSGGPPK